MGEKNVLISLNPQWIKPIFFTHQKLYEVRKRVPKLELPYDVYVYCTKGGIPVGFSSKKYNGYLNGLIVGKFTCTDVVKLSPPWHNKSAYTCLTDKQIAQYSNGDDLYFMMIENPEIFEQPIGLGCFGIETPPQSWRYIEVSNG